MNTLSPVTLHIDMVSDIVCPWCTIGYQRLQKALQTIRQQWPDLNIELSFQPFELNPHMPGEGQNVNEHIAEKYGADQATIDQNRQNLRAIGVEEGVTFNTHSESRIYNTFLAHKLLHKAEELGTQEALKLALFEAYFSERKNISDSEILIDIACKHGFTRESAQQVIDNESITQQVRQQQQHYSQMGITAVPTFVFNDRFTVSGAQDASTLANVMQDILSKA